MSECPLSEVPLNPSPDSCGVIYIDCLSFKDDVDFYSLNDYAARAFHPMILPIAILGPHVTW